MPVNAIVGYDGSPAANAAIDADALLLPNEHGWITHLWVSPYASGEVRRRLRAQAHNVSELIERVQRGGAHEAQRLLASCVTLTRHAGWDAEPLLKRSWGAALTYGPDPHRPVSDSVETNGRYGAPWGVP